MIIPSSLDTANPESATMRHLPSSTSVLLILLLLAAAAAVSTAGRFDYPTANLSTTWTLGPSLPHNITYPNDGSAIVALLLRGNFGPSFAFGFYCNAACDAFLLSIFIIYTNSGSLITNPTIAAPQVVWSANRDRPVRLNSTLSFSSAGDLVLRDADGSFVWSTNTSSRSVVGMSLTDSGNLVLVDEKNVSVWDSFDHPTDALIVGQTLKEGQRLTSNVSNWTRGQYYITVLSDGMHAFVDSNPPQPYSDLTVSGPKSGRNPAYLRFTNGTLQLFVLFTQPNVPDNLIELPSAPSVQYMRLEPDGHLRLYQWFPTGWALQDEVLKPFPDDCAFPTVCGSYGICSRGQCSCPRGNDTDQANFFRPVNARQSNLGCSLVTPLSCQSIQNHRFLSLKNMSYFNHDDSILAAGLLDEESCKQACLRNCSCKAAIFLYGVNASSGTCYLPTQLFSLMNNQPEVVHYNSSTSIKVQVTPAAPSPGSGTSVSSSGSKSVGVIVGSVVGSSVVIFLAGIVILLLRRRKAEESDEEGVDCFDQVAGMPTRFSFEELKIATENFCKKLGEGGFGSVFEGKLDDGVKIAVKRLDGIGQGKREFLAEVQTIGSIHHINLVRLIGFCAEKSYRLLVYEYMCNGSLEKWIFYEKQNAVLDWERRHKIITDIAKGLSYLHEECRQRIVHLDIKPQNILLDDKFNAKVSDFGLAKLIDRDEIDVVTRMRGTPGYLAPEWLTSIINEKVDVYSFGVVVMEIVCGRKNLDYSQPEERTHLLSLLQEMIKTDQLLDLVDSHIDSQFHGNEIVKMIDLAVWCLQSDSNKRPSMSTVVKVLEGSRNLDANLDYNFSAPTILVPKKLDYINTSAPPMESVLSGPR